MKLSNRRDRARGSFLGLAVGDALGGPLEGLGAQQIHAHYGVVTDYVDGVRAWRRRPYCWREPGLYTDDTQHALILADGLLRHGEVVPERIIEAFGRLANPRGRHLGAHRGASASLRKVLDRIEEGSPIAEAGSVEAGIGAAMRAAPLGIYHDDCADLTAGVALASYPTHRDIRSIAGAAAVALAVRRILRFESAEEKRPSFLLLLASDVARAEAAILEQLGETATGLEHRHAVSSSIAAAESVLELDRDKAFGEIMEQANRQGAHPFCRRPTMGFPPGLIPACLYLFFVTESFEEALIEVVNLGGDADTAGSILGALAGAYYGISRIPDRWLDGLQNRAAIESMADALADRSAADLMSLDDLLASERALSDREDRWRHEVSTSGSKAGGSDLGAHRKY